MFAESARMERGRKLHEVSSSSSLAAILGVGFLQQEEEKDILFLNDLTPDARTDTRNKHADAEGRQIKCTRFITSSKEEREMEAHAS